MCAGADRGPVQQPCERTVFNGLRSIVKCVTAEIQRGVAHDRRRARRAGYGHGRWMAGAPQRRDVRFGLVEPVADADTKYGPIRPCEERARNLRGPGVRTAEYRMKRQAAVRGEID